MCCCYYVTWIHPPISYLRVEQLEERAVALAVLRGRGDPAQVAAGADDGLLLVCNLGLCGGGVTYCMLGLEDDGPLA